MTARTDRALVGLLVLVSLCSGLLGMTAATAQTVVEPPLQATPQLPCGEGSNPETGIQGRVPRSDHASGRAAEGYWCNAELVSSVGGDAVQGTQGGFKVERYVDAAGRECAYYDTTLLFGTDLFDGGVGVDVVDMTDPERPVRTTSLVSPAMDSPHESLLVSQERGLLLATLGNAAFNVGVLDIYDISGDCRRPRLLSSGPAGVIGHESGLAPDGMTFYSASPGTRTLFAVDISDPRVPVPIVGYDIDSHGLSISADGTRAYVAALSGLVILDVSEVQARKPDPVIREVSRLTWRSMSIPQNAIPISVGGEPYVVEIDEFGSGDAVGAVRIIDIGDEKAPFVLSNLRLEVHQPENFAAQADDYGNQSPIQGYAGHYCDVPTRVDPEIVACSMIMSGLRVFNIEDPANPVEIAYYNAPAQGQEYFGGNYAMSSPAFVPARNEIWYSDGFTGFHVVRLTDGAFAPRPAAPTTTAATPATDGSAGPATTGEPAAGPATLPTTGGPSPAPYVAVAVAAALGALALTRRRPTSSV